MSKFKVGELIRCMNASQASELTVGKTYLVLDLDEENDPYVESDCGQSYPYASFRFELAESEKKPAEPAIQERVTPKIERSTLMYNYLAAKNSFERASNAYNAACQAIRDNVKDGEKFVYTRYGEGYIVSRDAAGFTVDKIDMV